ncbi:hypothetical protein F5Y13DRAFT_21775 [Hypoxylon sp. FL1857]|nr:hypothetical protein F5Y13DRAFT_21775 [Hypoxylon sp. FL1857]
MDSSFRGEATAPYYEPRSSTLSERLFSSNYLNISEDTKPCNFITFLATVQSLNLEIFPVPWQPSRQSIGHGGTSQISQASVNVEAGIAFKRVSNKDKLLLEDKEIFRRLLSEIVVLGYPTIRGYPYILELQAISWDVSPKTDTNNMDSGLSNDNSSISKVWPVLMFEMSRYGDLYQFATSPAGRGLDIKARIDICMQIGMAIGTMHAIRVVHGDIKPHNVIMFKQEDASFIAKVADFGYSSPYSVYETPLELPRSHPWYAPEVLEYPNFTLAQASTADIFSYGMLCLWFLFEEYLSGELLPNAIKSMPFTHTQEDKQASLRNLAYLRENNYPLVQLSEHLIAAHEGLDTQTMLMLRQFFRKTIAHSPNERENDIAQLFSHLDPSNEISKQEVDAFEYHSPADQDSFSLVPSLRVFYLSDYRVRSYLVACMEEILLSDSTSRLDYELSLCYAIGFGNSATATEQQSLQEEAKRNQVDLKRELGQGPVFIENVGSFFSTLIESRYMAETADLTEIYREHDVLEEALAVTKRDFESVSHVLGPEHLITVDLANILSLITYSAGQWDESERFGKYVVDALEKRYGEKHGDTITGKLHLSAIYWNQNRLVESERMERDCMDVCLSEFGKENLLTLTCMADLAATLGKIEQWEEAERLGTDVMNTFQRLLGPEHPTTLAHMSVLATIYHGQGRLGDAIDLEEAVLEVTEKVLGFEHLDALTSLTNLAKWHWENEDWEGAAGIQVAAVEATTRVLGPEHPESLRAMGSFADMYEEMGTHDEAEKLRRQIMNLRMQALGSEHPDTLRAMGNLAVTLGDQGKWEEAEEIQLKVLEATKKLRGPRHPDTLTAMSNLAFTWKDKGQHEKAIGLMEQCLTLQQEELGIDHPDSVDTMETLEEWQQTMDVDNVTV